MSALGVYVHWPYCATICPYCDFNVFRARDHDPAPLIAAIVADMAEHAARFEKRNAVSLFLGGGTPSLLRGAELARLIEGAERAFGLSAECEITLECNPEDAPLFAEQAAAGVNRFSIGAQAFDDASLRALGRRHDAASAFTSVAAAARTGKRVSLDLIYAREAQNPERWRAELEQALALPVEHLSLYQLTIEPDTAFARRAARGQLRQPSTDEAAALYELTQSICDAHGFTGYEISNHARDAAARSRHNLLYWRGENWIGVGPGAHGRITHAGARIATEAQRRPRDYIDAVREHGVGWLIEERLNPEQEADEALLMGLRIDEGFDVARVEALRGRPLNAAARGWLAREALILDDGARIRLSAKGRLLANAVAAELAS